MTEPSSNVPVSRFALQNGSLLRVPSCSQPLSVSMLRRPRPLVLSGPPSRPRVVGVAALTPRATVKPRIFLVPQGQVPGSSPGPDRAGTSGVFVPARPPAGKLKVINKPLKSPHPVSSVLQSPVSRAEPLPTPGAQLAWSRKPLTKKRVLPSHMATPVPVDNGAPQVARPPGVKVKLSGQRPSPLPRRRSEPEPLRKPQLSWDLDLLAGDGLSSRLAGQRYYEDSDGESSSGSEDTALGTAAARGGTVADARLKKPAFSLSPRQYPSDRSESPEVLSPAAVDSDLRHIHDDWALIKRSLHAAQSRDPPQTTKTKKPVLPKPPVDKVSTPKTDAPKTQRTPATKKKRGRPRKQDDEKQSMSDYWKHKVMSPERTEVPALSAETSQHVDDVISSVIAASTGSQALQKAEIPSAPSVDACSPAETASPAVSKSSELSTAPDSSSEVSSEQKLESSEDKSVVAPTTAPSVGALFGDVCETVVRMFSEQATESLCAPEPGPLPAPVISLRPSLSASRVFVMSEELYRLGSCAPAQQLDTSPSLLSPSPAPGPDQQVPLCVPASNVQSLLGSQRAGDLALRDASVARLCSVQVEERPGVLVFLDSGGEHSPATVQLGEGQWRCNRCSSSFPSLADQLLHQLRCHMLQHDRVVCVGCPLVARRLPPPQLAQQLRDLLAHVVRHVDGACGGLLGPADPVIRQLSGDSMLLACGACPRVFSSGCAFGEHELGCARLEHVCGTCGARYADSEHLTMHELEHRRALDGRFSCDICSCSFNKVEQLAAHRRFHFKEKNVSCPQCERRFVSVAMLNMHVKWKHSDGPCRFCQRHFNSATARKVHEEHSHLKQLPLMCGQCQLRVATPSQLRVHRRLHEQLSPHGCSSCSASFVSRGLLRKHVIAEHQEGQREVQKDGQREGQEVGQREGKEDGQEEGQREDGGSLRRMFDIYRTSFEGAVATMTLSDLDTESDEEEHQSRRDIEATQQMFQHKDKQTKSVWSCPMCKLYFTKLWGVRAHITLKHPGASIDPVLHDASHSGAASKKAFLRELKRKLRFDKKQDRLAIKMQERLARYGAGGPRRGRPLKNPLFAARPRKPSLPPPADGIPRKRGRPRKVPLAPGETPSPPKPKLPKLKAEGQESEPALRQNGTCAERRRWRCELCSSVTDSYDELVTHTYAQHSALSLPRFSVLVEPLPPSHAGDPSPATPPVPRPPPRGPEKPRGARRPRGKVVARRSSVTSAASTADLYRRQYNTLSGSRRRSLVPPEPRVAEAPAPEPQRLYCVCQVPYQEGVEMIGCDGPQCRNEWFHFTCVNIVSAPKGNWFCPDCAK